MRTENTTVWRYIDFADLVAMLEYGGLFFATPKCFEDPYEGALNIGSREKFYSQLPSSTWESIKSQFGLKDFAHSPVEQLKEFIRCLKQVTYVNCWHQNNVESVAMWRLYSINQLGLALRSSVETLKRELEPRGIQVSPIRYIDYFQQSEIEMEPATVYFYKRKGFEHEKELRAFFMKPEQLEKVLEQRKRGKQFKTLGQWIPINLEALIDEIVVSPGAEPWFKDLVERLLRRYQLSKAVRTSELLKDPLFPNAETF